MYNVQIGIASCNSPVLSLSVTSIYLWLGKRRTSGQFLTMLLSLPLLLPSLSLSNEVFSEGPSQLVDAVMTNDFSSILVRCVHLFLDLPPPSPPTKPRSLSGKSICACKNVCCILILVRWQL